MARSSGIPHLTAEDALARSVRLAAARARRAPELARFSFLAYAANYAHSDRHWDPCTCSCATRSAPPCSLASPAGSSPCAFWHYIYGYAALLLPLVLWTTDRALPRPDADGTSSRRSSSWRSCSSRARSRSCPVRRGDGAGLGARHGRLTTNQGIARGKDSSPSIWHDHARGADHRRRPSPFRDHLRSARSGTSASLSARAESRGDRQAVRGNGVRCPDDGQVGRIGRHLHGLVFLGAIGLPLLVVGIVTPRETGRERLILALLVAIPLIDLAAVLAAPLQERLRSARSSSSGSAI